MLEADPCFRETIRDYLVEHGYSVVAVENGQQAFREITSGNFALVLYDSLMRGVSVEMFYQAVGRLDPGLCERFVFMADDRADEATKQFIRNSNRFVLRKPFQEKDLLDAITVAELCGAYQSVFDDSQVAPEDGEISEPAYGLLSGTAPASQPSVVAKILARAKARRAPVREPQAPGPVVSAGGGMRAFVVAGLALAIVMAGGLWKRYSETRDRVAAMVAGQSALDEEWKTISQELEKAVATQSKVEMIQTQLAGISADRAKPRLAPALRSVVDSAGLQIQLREVRAQEKSGDEKMWTLLVGGISTGLAPRAVAERYRADLQREFDRIFHGGVSIRFERFEDLPDSPSALPRARSGAFTILATIRFGAETKAESEEGA